MSTTGMVVVYFLKWAKVIIYSNIKQPEPEEDEDIQLDSEAVQIQNFVEKHPIKAAYLVASDVRIPLFIPSGVIDACSVREYRCIILYFSCALFLASLFLLSSSLFICWISQG